MKIDNFIFEQRGDFTRAGATVTWEDCDRPKQEIFFATPMKFGKHLSCNPNAYLLACILPAIYHGERRIKLDGEICPELREGILTVLALFRSWYGPEWSTPQIEAKVSSKPAYIEPRYAGSFLSGGIDSLALLRANRLTYTETHTRSIKYCFMVYGFSIGQIPEMYDEHDHVFESIIASLSGVEREAKTTLIPVYTNIRHLYNDVDFWCHQFHGAALASVAHSFARLVDNVSIASSDDTTNIKPWGSHPLIDPYYSSSDLRIRHEGVIDSRLAKTKMLAEWPAALKSIHVCLYPERLLQSQTGILNCGKCEKCIRTMSALLALGALERCPAFPDNDVSKKLLSTVVLRKDYEELYYRELIEPLRSQGRNDLAEEIKKMIFRYYIRRKIKNIDEKLLGNKLRSLKNSLSGKAR
jgi:hypothetical protein